jgi:hypothetical protein
MLPLPGLFSRVTGARKSIFMTPGLVLMEFYVEGVVDCANVIQQETRIVKEWWAIFVDQKEDYYFFRGKKTEEKLKRDRDYGAIKQKYFSFANFSREKVFIF